MVTTCHSDPYTILALDSFFEYTAWQDGDVFLLIDNDGAFGGNLPQRWRDHITLVINPQPLSFAANGNQLIRRAACSNSDAYLLNNDVVFTPAWAALLAAATDSVVTPVCNRDFQYRSADLELKPTMTLDDYVGRERQFLEVVWQHQARNKNFMQAYFPSFFAVKIPALVYRSVGLFDTQFGRGGGEDSDYCIRTYLCGFRVLISVASYVLHFGGRSTWAGPETPEQRRAREQQYIHAFQKKWGRTLSHFVFQRDASVLSDPSLQTVQQCAGIAGMFAEMASRDGIRVEDALAGAGSVNSL
jgi:GT2 family glycosyltransferase